MSPRKDQNIRRQVYAEEHRDLVGTQPDRHRCDRAGEHGSEQDPAARECNRRPERLVLKYIVSSGPRHHGPEFGTRDRSGEGDHAPEEPEEVEVNPELDMG